MSREKDKERLDRIGAVMGENYTEHLHTGSSSTFTAGRHTKGFTATHTSHYSGSLLWNFTDQ